MAPEDFDKKKLRPILDEAYEFLCQLEEKLNSTSDMQEKCTKQRRDLLERKKKLKACETVEEMQENTKLLFKSIMCPLGDKCPKDNRARWPKSSTKTVTPFGRNCLYAHHYLELEFPQTLNTKISALTTMKKAAGANAQTKAKAGKNDFIPASTLKDCKGCLNCNFCRFKQQNAVLKPEEQKKINEKYQAQMKKREDPETVKYVDEMRELKKKMSLDDNYFKKFGLLKKAAVLLYYERDNEAMDTIAKAVAIA